MKFVAFFGIIFAVLDPDLDLDLDPQTHLDPDPKHWYWGIQIPYRILNVPEIFTFVVRDSAGGGGNLLPVHEDSWAGRLSRQPLGEGQTFQVSHSVTK